MPTIPDGRAVSIPSGPLVDVRRQCSDRYRLEALSRSPHDRDHEYRVCTSTGQHAGDWIPTKEERLSRTEPTVCFRQGL